MKTLIAAGCLALAVAGAGCSDDSGPLPVDPAPGEPSPVQPDPATLPPTTGAGPDADAPPSQTTPGPIPIGFRHVWAINPSDCTSEPGLTRIAIAPSAVKFYEGRADVVSATQPHKDALTLEVSHTSEGAIALETHALVLDADANRLTYGRSGEEFTYSLCS